MRLEPFWISCVRVERRFQRLLRNSRCLIVFKKASLLNSIRAFGYEFLTICDHQIVAKIEFRNSLVQRRVTAYHLFLGLCIPLQRQRDAQP